MQDAQDERSQIYLNYVTKGPNVIANISRKFYYCVLFIVYTIYIFLKSKKKKKRFIKFKVPFSFQTLCEQLHARIQWGGGGGGCGSGPPTLDFKLCNFV